MEAATAAGNLAAGPKGRPFPSRTPRRIVHAMSLRRLLPFLLGSLLFTATLGAPASGEARDLRGRLGVGFNNNFSSLTSISVKYGIPTNKETINLQVQALVGFAFLKDQDDRFFAGGRLIIPILAEDNLNLYAGIGGGYVRFHDTKQAARIGAVVGVEFFLFGLENLGLSAEFGLNLDLGNQVLDVQTTGGTAAAVGVHYYF